MSNKNTNAMSEQNSEKPGLLLQLRFPQFRNAGEWGSAFGNRIFDQITNKDHDSDLPILAITQEQGAIPRKLIDYHVSVADKSIEGYKVVEVGDFIISLRSFQGGIEYSRYKGICSPAYVILRLKSGYSADYFRHFLKTDRFIGLLVKNLEGLRDGKMVSYKQFSELQLPTPSLQEQKKIADCLSSLDDLITAEFQKLDALKTHKKGLMQQLFPCEDETVPRLRFPEFRKAGDWVKIAAGQLFSNRTERGESKRPIYSVTMNDGLVPRNSLDRRIEDVAEPGANKTVRRGDIAYNMMRMWQGALGVAPEDCMVSPAYTVLEPQAGVNSFFFYFLLKLPKTLQVLTAHSRGLTEDRLRLYYEDFAKVILLCPSPAEQGRIADCLSSLDDRISVQSEKVNALKSHKEGLMQQLFPVMAEVQA